MQTWWYFCWIWFMSKKGHTVSLKDKHNFKGNKYLYIISQNFPVSFNQIIVIQEKQCFLRAVSSTELVWWVLVTTLSSIPCTVCTVQHVCTYACFFQKMMWPSTIWFPVFDVTMSGKTLELLTVRKITSINRLICLHGCVCLLLFPINVNKVLI